MAALSNAQKQIQRVKEKMKKQRNMFQRNKQDIFPKLVFMKQRSLTYPIQNSKLWS